MTTSSQALSPQPRPSRQIAAEIRAEMGRAQINATELARRLHVQKTWLSRRIGRSADVELSFEEVYSMAEALGVSPQRLILPLLPRLDSNQQPSGYRSPQVRAVPSAPVVPIGAARGTMRPQQQLGRRPGTASTGPTTRPRALRLA